MYAALTATQTGLLKAKTTWWEDLIRFNTRQTALDHAKTRIIALLGPHRRQVRCAIWTHPSGHGYACAEYASALAGHVEPNAETIMVGIMDDRGQVHSATFDRNSEAVRTAEFQEFFARPW